MSEDWPKWADMNWLRLLEGPGDLVELPIAPTMKNLTYQGERYFRMPDSRSSARDSEDSEDTAGRTGCGGAYLWRGWSPVPVPSPVEGSAP